VCMCVCVVRALCVFCPCVVRVVRVLYVLRVCCELLRSVVKC